MDVMPSNTVELKVPVKADYVSVIRLLISGLGTRLGLPLDELDNLKLVVGEAFLAIIERCESVAGLINLKWKQDQQHISVSISDPAGKHKSVTNTASLALLKNLGGEYNTSVVDGEAHLNIDFKIRYKEQQPFIFHDQEDGQA